MPKIDIKTNLFPSKSVKHDPRSQEEAKKETLSLTDVTVESRITVPYQLSRKEEMNKIRLIDQNVFVILMSFLLGLENIAALSAFYYQKDTLNISPELIQFYQGIIWLPWSIKPVFGFSFDQIMKRTKKTKYTVYCCSVIKFVVYLWLVTQKIHWVLFYVLNFINVLASLYIAIICEYLLVLSTKKANEENQTNDENHLPVFYGYRCAGSLIGQFFGGRIIERYGLMQNFYLAMLVPIIALFVAFLYREDPIAGNAQPRTLVQEMHAIKSLLFRDKIIGMICFVLLLNMTPSFDSLTTFYMTDELKFSSTDLSDFSTFSTFTYLFGLIFYSKFCLKISPSRVFLSTNILLWIFNVSFLSVVFGYNEKIGVSNKLFCFFTQGVQSFVSELNFLPLLAIWCAICPKNLEATSITLFTGLINLASSFSCYLGSLIQILLGVGKENLNDIWIPLLIQNGYLLVMTVCIFFIDFPDASQINQQNQANEQEKKEATKVD